VRSLIIKCGQAFRAKRAETFNTYLRPSENDRILDLGSEDGSHIASITPLRRNVFIADISPEALDQGKAKYGFTPILLNEDGKVPVPDKWFDIVFCNSVIEHVTITEEVTYAFRTNQDFARTAFLKQKLFADEIRRIGKRYFVQSPYKYFPIETHSWFPFLIVILPRKLFIRLINFNNLWWIKKTNSNFHLLTGRDMHALFPEAEIIIEKFFGFNKSIIAIKN
jgi:hypothetical protein